MGEHQLSLLATVTLAWAAIYGYVAIYSFTLHNDRPAEHELRPFAIASFGMMLYAIGAAVLDDARTTAGAVLAFRIVMVGGFVATAGFMHFAHTLTQRPIGVLVRGSYWLALIGIMANLSGAMFDPTQPATPHPMLIQGASVPLLPALTPTYVVTTGPALIAIVVAAWIMRARTEDRRERFWLSATASMLGLAALHDALINLVPVRSVYLLEHCYLLCALAMTHHLLGRVARTDDELARRTQQLQESLGDLQRTEAELVHKEQLAAVGELSAIIAQEVRNPIAVMREALFGLQAGTRPPDRLHLLNVVDQESDRLNHLVGDLLSYAKPLHAQTSHVAVSALLDRALSTIPASMRANLKIDTRLCADPAALECDPELLHQALRNLIDNALTAMGGAGTLTVTTAACQHRGVPALQLSIADTGEGIETANQARVRTPFFTTRPAGNGLGLAIVDRVIRVHQGHVEIRSTAGRGTSIILTLPLQASSNALVVEATRATPTSGTTLPPPSA